MIASFTFAGLAGCERPSAAPAPRPATVLVAPAQVRDVPLYVEAVGTVAGYLDVDIRARVRGFLARQHHDDGTAVKAGQLLFTVERAQYEDALASARAALARARATQEHARVFAKRREELASQEAISRQDLDDAEASRRQADAAVQSAAADVRQAELNLSYTEIRSPVSGLVGVALVRQGNLVGQDGPTLLTTVSQIDPVRVTFPLSELDYVRAPDRLKRISGRDLAWARRQFARLDHGEDTEDGDPGVELVLSDGTVYPHRGVLVSANRQVDQATGTIQLQALFPNPDAALRPGQFGRVRMPRPDEGRNVVTVPEKAVQQLQGTFSVAVVGEGNKVQLRTVQVGPAAGGLRIVRSGLEAGERVVVEGLQRATDGAVVDPRPDRVADAR